MRVIRIVNINHRDRAILAVRSEAGLSGVTVAVGARCSSGPGAGQRACDDSGAPALASTHDARPRSRRLGRHSAAAALIGRGSAPRKIAKEIALQRRCSQRWQLSKLRFLARGGFFGHQSAQQLQQGQLRAGGGPAGADGGEKRNLQACAALGLDAAQAKSLGPLRT